MQSADPQNDYALRKGTLDYNFKRSVIQTKCKETNNVFIEISESNIQIQRKYQLSTCISTR